jgi:hypothetical protein
MVIYLNTKLQSMILKLAMKTLKKKDSKRSQCFTEKKRNRCRNIERNRQQSFETIRKMPEQEFERMFHMPRVAFVKLLKKIEPRLKKNIKYAKNSSHTPILPSTKLFATTRWLAGGS